MDPFDQWLAEECEVGPGNILKSSTSAELFESWDHFMAKAGYGRSWLGPTKKRLAIELHRRGFKNRRGAKGVRKFIGIRTRQPYAAFEEWPEEEIARILREHADMVIARRMLNDSGWVRDVNGNAIGRWEWKWNVG